jgi:hypothetical protein
MNGICPLSFHARFNTLTSPDRILSFLLFSIPSCFAVNTFFVFLSSISLSINPSTASHSAFSILNDQYHQPDNFDSLIFPQRGLFVLYAPLRLLKSTTLIYTNHHHAFLIRTCTLRRAFGVGWIHSGRSYGKNNGGAGRGTNACGISKGGVKVRVRKEQR